jgi:HD-GYP domain-containing protein (c-di-GMP phosphodiesterase class II)
MVDWVYILKNVFCPKHSFFLHTTLFLSDCPMSLLTLSEHHSNTCQAIRYQFDYIRDTVAAESQVSDNYKNLTALVSEEMKRDLPTRLHTERVAHYAYAIAKELGHEDDECCLLRDATRLHDVGKRYIPQAILYSTATQLSPKDYEMIKYHTVWGADLILEASQGPLAVVAAEIALYHHERYDGQGYHGLTADEIPWYVSLASLADTFDVMTSKRSYTDGNSPNEAVQNLHYQEKSQERPSFDPRVLNALTKIAADLHDSVHTSFPEDTVRVAEDELRKKCENFDQKTEYKPATNEAFL